MGWEKATAKNLKPVGFVPGSAPVDKDKKPQEIINKPSIPSWNAKPLHSQGSSLPLSIRPSAPPKTTTETSSAEIAKVEAKPKAIKRAAAGEVWEDPTLLNWDPTHFRIFVGNLSNDVTDQMLRTAFFKYASLSNVRVVRDRRSGRSKGYGFVALSDSDDYIKAMKEMNGKYIGSKPVKLTKSSWKDRNLDTDKPQGRGMGKNLKFQIAVEEAKAGLKPQIAWCKSVAKKDKSATSADLETLRKEKIKAKLFHCRKVTNKIAKKAKVFLVRKITRSLKTVEDDEKKKKLEGQLAGAKKLDHTMLGTKLLYSILKSDETVWSRMGEFVAEEEDTRDKIFDPQAIKKECDAVLVDIKSFLRKLYHDDEKEQVKEEKQKDLKKDREEEDYFVSSLSSKRPEKQSRATQFEDDDMMPRKKNRLGQRARRELWEKTYGDKAKHVVEAKRMKQKEKKIKGMDKPVNPNRASRRAIFDSMPIKEEKEALHPSWQAKLQQKQKLSEALHKSERIVFDD